MEKKGKFWYYCHNCGYSLPFNKFLEDINPLLYQQYVYERLQESEEGDLDNIHNPPPKKKEPLHSPFEGLKSISQLPPDHFAKKYIASRNLPLKFWSGMYFIEDFETWVNTLIPDKFYINPISRSIRSRIIIPLLTPNGQAIGFQGRRVDITPKDNWCARENNKYYAKYITIILDEDIARLYGLDITNLNKKFYLTEGPFDSMFLDNAMAVCGSDALSALHKIDANKDLAVVIYDNEPRNTEIVKKMKKTIRDGWKICIWPTGFDFKDINEGILGGLNPSEIMHIIDKNTYDGLSAELEFTSWSKV